MAEPYWLDYCDPILRPPGNTKLYYFRSGSHLIVSCFVHVGPGMVEALASKTIAWEKERGIEFLYDGVSLVLLRLGFV